ncbi:MAG: PEP-utilizing enzyme [Patescibacteria group bacterium]
MESYKKYKWEMVGNDFNSPFFRNYIWTDAPAKYPKLFGVLSIIVGILSRENKITYLADISTWNETHQGLKKLAFKDYKYVEKLIDKTNKIGGEFNSWSNKNIFKANLASKTSKQLIALYREFFERQAVMYAYGVLIPILDFQSFSFVEGNLNRILTEKVLTKDFVKYFDILTFPIHNSFAQDQEEDLLRLMSDFDSGVWRKDILSKSFEEVSKKYPKFVKRLKAHTEKHSWVYYVYAGPALTDVQFYEFIKEYLEKKVNPKKKLQELGKKRKEIAQQRKTLLKKLDLNAFQKSILLLAGKMVWAKPRRKDYQSRSYFHVERLQSEIGKRLFISLSQVRSAPIEVLEKALKQGNIDTDTLNSIYNFHICLPVNGRKVVVLHGEEANLFLKKHIKKESKIDVKNITEIQGATAHSGRAKGTVRIINSSEDMDKMKQGDVLVSMATTPSVVPAMKKASAIVTDEGGLTCHAAIVSRELGIPCVIGTKIATKVFKDGDVVEVDAGKGVIKLIKRK